MSEPKDHHFVPAFYLKRWAEKGADQKLVEYKLVHGGRVAHRLVTEDATGWEEHLYTQPALSPDLIQILEKRFFSYLDRRAAEALAVLGIKPHGPLTPDQRQAWAQFLTAYHLRHPDAFAELKAAAASAWDSGDEKSEQKYAEIRKPTDPATFKEFLASRAPSVRAKAITRLLMSSMDNKRVGKRLFTMQWYVQDYSHAGRLFLTSDRALQIGPLKDSKGFVSMPISPNQLFIAVNDPETAHRLRRARARDVVGEVNKWVVSRARRFVWAADRASEAFVEKHMGKHQEGLPLLPRLARGRPKP